MALIGIIFILTSAVMYFLFIIVLLTLRTELLGGYKDIIRITVGLIALIAGVINIKDFFLNRGFFYPIVRRKGSLFEDELEISIPFVVKADQLRIMNAV